MAAPLAFQSLATRLAILACFWLALLLSIPSWLRLTTIQRLPLPTRQVEAFQHQEKCPITFHGDLGVLVDPSLLPSEDKEDGGKTFLQQVEQLVQQSLDIKAHLPAAASLECMRWRVSIQSLHSKQEQQGYLLDPEKGRYVVRVLSEPILSSQHPAGGEASMPTVLIPLLKDPTSLPLVPDTISAAVVSELLHLLGQDRSTPSTTDSPADTEQDPRVIQYSKHIRLVFSIMNQDSTDGDAYDSALIHALASTQSKGGENPIGRVMADFKGLHDFHVETQVQWFAPLAFTPTQEVLEQVVEREVEETVMVDKVIEEEVEAQVDDDQAESDREASQAPSEERGEEAQVESQLPSRRTQLVKQSRTIQVPRTQRVIKQTRTPLPPRHVIEWDDLKVFVNSEEWSLTSTVPPFSSASNQSVLGRPFDVLSQTHDLHFLLYVPSKSNSPLLIHNPNTGGVRGEERGAWLIPQWGGVVILNTPHANVSSDTGLDLVGARGKQVKELEKEAVGKAITLFSRQLEILLGLPTSPHSPKENSNRGSDSELRRRIQLTTLKQKRILELTHETHSTLLAITRLVNKIENLGVGPDVKQDTEQSLAILQSLTQTPVDSKENGEGLEQVLDKAKKAYELSNRAFFNPDMLGLLYFPDEHKYAVYTPLFAPLLVPLIVNSVKLLKEALTKGKGRKIKGRKTQ